MSSHLATDWPTTAVDVLAAPRRRYVLSILRDRSAALDRESLATEVAVREHRSPIVTTDQTEDASVELVHRHLPRLIDAGLVTVATDGDGTRRYALAEHPMFEADWVQSLLERPRNDPETDEESLQRTLELLREPRRRTLVQILARQRDSLDVTDLAALYVTETNEDVRLVDLEEGDWKPVAIRLVHVDLPALDDAGLVDYDHSSGAVSLATDAPQWRMEWLAESPLADVVESVAGRDRSREEVADGGECWTITGREDVIARGCEIADSATDELVVTVPDAGLLQDRCLERWRAAADRGVDIYIGSRSREVCDAVQQVIPEATVCEPQFDWLNFPTDGIDHARLVFADRERVMLVTGAVADGEADATAITGSGAESPLVKLVRDHVEPRLERLQGRPDDGSESQQPSPLPL